MTDTSLSPAILLIEGQNPPEFSYEPVDLSPQAALVWFETQPTDRPEEAPFHHRETRGVTGVQHFDHVDALLALDVINDKRVRSFRRMITSLFHTQVLRGNRTPTAISILATQGLIAFSAATYTGERVLPLLDELYWTGVSRDTGLAGRTPCLPIFCRDSLVRTPSAHGQMTKLGELRDELALILPAAGFAPDAAIHFA